MPRSRKRPFEFFLNNDGIDESDGVLRQQPSSAEIVQNMHPNKKGEFTSHNLGYELLSSQLESGSRIDGIFAHTDDSGSSYLITSVNGKVLDIDSGTGANNGTITSENTAGEILSVTSFKGNAYIVDGTMTPKVWNGSGSASNLSSFPLTNGSDTYQYPEIVDTYLSRLVLVNFRGTTNYPSAVILSDTSAPDTYNLGTSTTDGAIIQVNEGDGKKITALYGKYLPALGQSYLFVFKQNSTYAITGSTPNPSGDLFNVVPINSKWGALNHRCVVEVGGDLLFMDEKNIYSLSTASQSGSLQPNVLGSKKVKDTLASMNVSQSKKAWAIHMAFRNEVWFGIPTGSSTEVDTVLVYNYLHQDTGEDVWVVRKGMDSTCTTDLSSVMYSGTSDGYVSKWFNNSEYITTGYNWVYRYPFYDFESRSEYKRLNELFAHFRIRSSTQVNFKTTWSIGSNISNSHSRTITGGSNATYGSSTYGADRYITSDEIVVEQIPVKGDGGLFQFEVSGTNDDVGTDFLGISGEVEFGGYIKRHN